MTFVSLSNGKLLATGTGSSLLRLKSEIRSFVPNTEILVRSKESFEFPVWYGRQITTNSSIEFSQDAIDAIRVIDEAVSGHIEAVKRVNTIIERGISSTESSFWNHILDPHQGIAVNCLILQGLFGLCLFDEQGTGKTLVSIAAFDILSDRGEIDRAFIVGPKSLTREWISEIRRFLDEKYRITPIEGNTESKFRALNSKSDIFVTNYESISSLTTSFCSAAKNFNSLLVIDESFFIKNPQAMRSSAIADLREACARSFVLCGTPAPNSPEDIINQFNLADRGYTFENFEVPEESHTAFEAIQNRILTRGTYIRRTKTDVLPDLPEKCFKLVTVEMVGKQLALYEKAKSELILYLKSLDNRTFSRNLTTYFQKRAALLQICVSPKLIDSLYNETPVKYVVLDKIVNDLVSRQQKKVIVWSVYTQTIDEIQTRYSHLGVSRVDGTIQSVQERSEAVRRFQEDPSVSLFIGNPAAAGAGLTLHASSDNIYISYSNQAAHYLQSLDRTHRRGQISDSVNYYFLLCQNSIELGEFERLRQKEQVQKLLLSDPKDSSVTLEGALDELLGSC